MVRFWLETFNVHEAHAVASISQEGVEIGVCTLEQSHIALLVL